MGIESAKVCVVDVTGLHIHLNGNDFLVGWDDECTLEPRLEKTVFLPM